MAGIPVGGFEFIYNPGSGVYSYLLRYREGGVIIDNALGPRFWDRYYEGQRIGFRDYDYQQGCLEDTGDSDYDDYSYLRWDDQTIRYGVLRGAREITITVSPAGKEQFITALEAAWQQFLQDQESENDGFRSCACTETEQCVSCSELLEKVD